MTWYSIKDIEQRTGLKPAFIRKVVKTCNDIFVSHTSRGDKNALQIDSSGLEMFDVIGQLKADGLSIPAIYDRLQTALQTEQPAPDKDTKPLEELKEEPVKTQEPSIDTYLLDKLLETQDKYVQDLRERDDTITQLTREKDALAATLKALPEGKSPEQIKDEYIEQRLQKAETTRLLNELKSTTGLFQGRKRRELIAELDTLLTK